MTKDLNVETFNKMMQNGKGMTSGPLGRDSMAFQNKMKRYHAEIERLVYAAEIACNCRKKNGDCLHLQGFHSIAPCREIMLMSHEREELEQYFQQKAME